MRTIPLIQIGSRVIRIGSIHRKTTGRIGEVIEINEYSSPKRIRVQWKIEANGNPVLSAGKNTGNGIKTWVSQNKLKLL